MSLKKKGSENLAESALEPLVQVVAIVGELS